MTDEIKPALTAEEWAERTAPGVQKHIVQHAIEGAEHVMGLDLTPRALATLCLHGQPFGFTHEDVRDLEDAASRIEYEDHMQAPLAARLGDLAARIAALLPPEAPEDV